MRVLVYIMAGIILTVILTLFIVDAQAANVKVTVPVATNVTCSQATFNADGSITVKIDSQGCKTFKVAVGPLGNVSATCIKN